MTENGLGHLRPCGDDDVLRMRQWRNHPDVRAMMYTQHEISEAEHLAWWARTRDRADAAYLIYETGGLAMGVVAFTEIAPGHGTAFWAFYADPDAPRGTGSRMEWLALDHAFGPLRLRKLNCEVLARNKRVLRLHARFGFVEEGVFAGHLRIGETFETVHRLAIFAPGWASSRDSHLHRLTDRSPT